LAGQPGITAADLGSALAREMAAHQDDYFILVLDDFQVISNEPAAIVLINALLAQLPEQAHLLIAGRILPRLNYAVLMAQDQLAGLDEAKLRFTAEEVQALFRLRNQLEVPRETAQDLVDNAEGWITGILLTSHLLWQGLVAKLVEARASDSPVFEYLAAEVLEQQPAELQRFLLESAVLPDMEALVCDAALGRSDSAERLREAQSRRLFVSTVGEDTPAYQYHHLFRDFLLARLRAQKPERLRQIQSGAARWYAEHDMPEAAVTYYVQAADLEAAAQLAESEARRLYDQGRFATLRQWAEQLAPVAQHVPRLFLFVGTADLDSGKLNRALRAFDQADAGFAVAGQQSSRIGVEIRRCIAIYQQGRFDEARIRLDAAAAEAEINAPPTTLALALRHLGNSYLALGRASDAEAALSRARALWANAADGFNLGLTLADLSAVYRVRGKSALASQAQHEALNLLRSAGAVLPLVHLLNNIGWDMYMLGQYEAAMSTYAEAIEWARRGGVQHLERSVLEGQAAILADLGDVTTAASIYNRLLQQSDEVAERHILIYVCAGLARIDRRGGNFSSALEWVRRAQLHQQGYHAALPMSNVAGLHAILQVEIGHAEAGLIELRQVVADQENAEAVTDLAQSLFYCACAKYRTGQPEAAAADLNRAFDLAEQVGYEQMLLREAPMAADVLEGLRQHPAVGQRAAGLSTRSANLAAARTRLAARGVLMASEAPAPPAPSGLEVYSLGRVRVVKDGVELQRGAWTAQRARDLFLFLVDRMPVSREAVLTTFWGEFAQARAIANLNQTLYRLRKALGTDVVVLEDTLCRPGDGLTLVHDATEFEHEARAALAMPRTALQRLGTLDRAAHRYTGDYLPDMDMSWAVERREALRQLFLNVLLHLADEYMLYTQFGDARAVLERALTAEHLRDDFHSRMLTCLAALGRRHEMVDHYQRYRETLRAELGLDPPPELRQLYARLIG
jgi:ATP/maltotriose-dependent transcriptional regulator MalT/DNA-binding SARP family transcriptional activator